MRYAIPALGAVLALGLACEAPDPERDGFVVVDEAARAAGVEVEVAGARHAGALPVAVLEGEEAAVIRRGGREAIAVGPGELVEVVGPEGAVRRGRAPRDSIWLGGDEASVAALAEMIGARATPLPGGGWSLEGSHAFVLASMIGSGPGVGAVHSMTAASQPSDVVQVGLFLDRPTADPDASPLEGATPDAAALVGLYVHGDVRLLLDAAGGWSLFVGDDERPARGGTYGARPGGVELLPNDGGSAAVMALTGEALVDDLGVSFSP